MRNIATFAVLLALGSTVPAAISPVLAQDAAAPAPAAAADTDTLDPTPPGTLNPQPLPPLANPDAPTTPAKELFGRALTPYPGPAEPIGSYADGCLAGAKTLPITGPDWQVMRLSRDRNWGTPRLIKFIERFGANAKKVGWNGLLIGDMSQPRGGPMISGHASHQIGLDVDIWFTPMPDHVLSREEREMDGAVDMVAPDRLGVDPKVWTHTRTAMVKAAAEDPVVTRIFVNAAIKKQMCGEAGADRLWLAKVRPWWGHAEHFHVRLACPPDDKACKDQPPVPPGDGCGHALDYWFRPGILHPAPPEVPAKPKPQLTLAGLPKACRKIVMAK
ncbi:MAG TPA: penicillin-insensitive murein endopeptidase [Xanthobacteraceae bacterium]|nr:penicillin-insensitive murein endopeptidase [Xanthobacteraceae bacterium]